MAIEKRWIGSQKVYVPVCDLCGCELEEEYDFYDAVDAKTGAGWKSRKVGYLGDWEDVCPECLEEEERENAVGDFNGLKGRL